MADLGLVGIVDRGEYSASVTYNQGSFVYYNGSTWLALQDNLYGVTPQPGASWKYLARGFAGTGLSDLQAKDMQGLISSVGNDVNAQLLLDEIADRVANKLLQKSSLVNSALATTPGVAALDAVMGKTLQDQITAMTETQQKTYPVVYGLTITATKIGKYVNISVTGVPTGISGSTILMVLDSVYRPVSYMGWNTYVSQGTAKTNFLFRVDVNGNITLNPPGGALSEYINIRYSYGI